MSRLRSALLPTRRHLLIGSAALASVGLLPGVAHSADEAKEIRPFRIDVPDVGLTDLRRRLAATRWPDRETVSDPSRGARLETIQSLVRYWATDYDWRKTEMRLNALPQFVTEIDGLDIQFAHIRSRHEDALPLIMTHGWPGSVIELLKIVAPLTDPTAHGGSAEDAFDLVLRSLPGHGFSEKPRRMGWGPDRVARAWAELMRRLGYTHYVSQGGDHGSVVSNWMARQAPVGLLGIHVNMPATVPPDIARVLRVGDPAPAGLSPAEKTAFTQLEALLQDRRRLCRADDDATSNARLRAGGLARRAGQLLLLEVQRLDGHGGRARASPNAGRHAGRHFALLAHQHRDLGCPGSTGRTTPTTSMPSMSRFPPPSPYSPARSIECPEAGRSAATTTCSTGARLTGAATSRPGSNRPSSPLRSARRSDRCVDGTTL